MTEPESIDAPVDTPSPPPTKPKTLGELFSQMTLDTAAMLLGAAIILVGSLGPWATSPIASANGTSGDGVITLVCAIVIGLAAAFTKDRAVSLLAILGAGAIGIYDFIHTHNALRHATVLGVQVDHVGWGLYAVVIGAVIALGGLVKRATDPRL